MAAKTKLGLEGYGVHRGAAFTDKTPADVSATPSDDIPVQYRRRFRR